MTHLFAEADIMTGKVSVGQLLAVFAVLAGGAGIYYAYRFITSIKSALTTVVAGVAILAAFLGNTSYEGVKFDAKVKDYMIGAYKTTDKQKAKKYIGNILDYLSATGADRGHAAVLAGGQTDDMQEWSADLRKILNEMEEEDQKAATQPTVVVASLTNSPAAAPESDTPKVPVWKTRLKDMGFVVEQDGKDPSKLIVQHPFGASLAPYNFYHVAWGLMGLAVTVFGGGWTGIAVHLRKKYNKQESCQYCGRKQEPVAHQAAKTMLAPEGAHRNFDAFSQPGCNG